MGLILSGAMAGGGAALQQSGLQLQRQWGAEDLEKMREDAANARQTALLLAQDMMQTKKIGAEKEMLDTREAGEDRRLTKREAGETSRLGTREAGANTRLGTQLAHAEILADMQKAWQGEQNQMQRDLTREQIASQKAIAAGNNSIAREIAKLGGTVQQDKEGNFLFLDKAGNAKPIMDPNDQTKPLKGYKDLTPAAKAYADVIKAQLVGLNAQEASGTGDAATITQKRVQLNAQLLNVLTGGIDAAGKGQPSVEPSAGDIAGLKARAKNPAAIATFEAKFGAGSAAKYLPATEKAREDKSASKGGIIRSDVPGMRPAPGSVAERLRNRGLLSPLEEDESELFPN